MKKRIGLIFLLMLAIAILVSCGSANSGAGDAGEKTPSIAISEDGYWIINGEKSEFKAIGEDGADGKDGFTPTIEISADGYWVINGEKTNVLADASAKEEGTPGLAYYLKDDGTYAVGAGTTKYLSDIVIPASYQGRAVTEIAERGFEEHKLQSVTIPDSVTTIGYDAFYYCENLTSVVIPDSVTSIGYEAFDDCDSLTSVYITDIAAWCNIVFGNSYANPLCCAKNLYLNGELITELVIPDGITSIGNSAFYSCDSLTSVVIPDSVETLGAHAFADCDQLSEITLEESLVSIGEYAFKDCDSLTSVVIPDSVTSIGNQAFDYCYKLVEVINRSSLNIQAGSSNYGYVAYYAKEVHNGESKIDRVDDYLFYTYEDVHYLLGYVGNDTELTLPDSYKGENYKIYKYAFYNRDDLTSVVIPDSVTTIGYVAFYDCDSLTSVVIPDSVTTIGDRAFRDCDSLASIKYRGTEEQWNAISKGSDWNYNTGSYTITYNYVGE